jgi:superfamily I DNA/RNA helicase
MRKERIKQATLSISRKIADIEDDTIKEDSVSTAAEINGLLFGYALTIHKSQGSQWKKVYCIFHNSHNRNLQRELLYTAITRAQKELFVICEPESFIQGVLSQHIVGNTLEEKAKFFIEKAEEAKKRKDLFNNGPEKE